MQLQLFLKHNVNISKKVEKGKKPLGNDYPVPLHPFFWAVGALFGK